MPLTPLERIAHENTCPEAPPAGPPGKAVAMGAGHLSVPGWFPVYLSLLWTQDILNPLVFVRDPGARVGEGLEGCHLLISFCLCLSGCVSCSFLFHSCRYRSCIHCC